MNINPFNTLESVIERPEVLADKEPLAGLGRTGMLGYVLGTLGLFVYFRMFSVVPPGKISFLLMLSIVLLVNLLFTAVMHLFMELTGVSGRAGRLFHAFGYSDYFLTLLVPAGFFVKLGFLNAFFCFCLCFSVVVYARVALVRKLYPVSANKAVLSVGLPYALFSGLAVLGFSSSIYWLVWLVM